MDYDAIVIGAGPAGLSAATALARTNRRVLVLDRACFGGQVMNLERVEDYPRPGESIEGPLLGSRLVGEAEAAGARLELEQAVEIEAYSGCVSVACEGGKAYTAAAVIVAGGVRPRKLGIPGEDRFEGKGMIHCAFCDAGLYAGQAVAVCGGGDSGLVEAMTLAKHARKVFVIEAQSGLTASPAIQARARDNGRIEVRCGAKALEVCGGQAVAGLLVEQLASGRRETLAVEGVLVHAGFEAASDWVQGALPLEERGYVAAGSDGLTGVAGIFAAGDIRSGAGRRVASAIADGAATADSVRRFLESLR